MKILSISPDDYLSKVPDDRREAMSKLREVFRNHLPPGFEETISYDTIGFVVPKSVYPAGYHCNPETPLPFINLASQKNFMAVYHMGLYADPVLLDWFTAAYPAHSKTRLDMGKSCIRFKKPESIPFGLLGELAGKVTVQQWIDLYEKTFRNR